MVAPALKSSDLRRIATKHYGRLLIIHPTSAPRVGHSGICIPTRLVAREELKAEPNGAEW